MKQSEKNLSIIKQKYGDTTELFAVYGTLRRGNYNHGVLNPNNNNFIGRMKMTGHFKCYSLGGFPGIIPAKEGEKEYPVIFDVYAVPSNVVKRRVDMLEGYRGEEFTNPDHPNSNMYNKVQIETPWGPAWTYVFNSRNVQEERLIESGDWNAFRRIDKTRGAIVDVEVIDHDKQIELTIDEESNISSANTEQASIS